MPESQEDKAREERITMEIIVDAYGPAEQAMGWYYYLADNIGFPFTGRCTRKRRTSPLGVGEEVNVVKMAPEDDCMHEMFVEIITESVKYFSFLLQPRNKTVIYGKYLTTGIISGLHGRWLCRYPKSNP